MSTTSGPTRRVDPERLSGFATAVLTTVGLPREDAELVADSLVRADLWAHQSHGVLRLPWYVNRILSGAMRPVSEPELVVDAGAVAVIDGHDGVGQVLTAHAAQQAGSRAQAHGVGAVGVRNSNHFGTAAYFTRMLPPQGCIGILTTNASPAMAPWGGREKRVGANPWSVAAPAGTYGTLVLDIANTAVARGKMYLARQRGEPIPEGWGLDAAGHATTDPVEAIAGTVAPMAEHKGYAISVVMDVLSGVLTGSAFGSAVTGPYQADQRSGAGHLFIALDVGTFLPYHDFEARMGQLIDELKSTPRADGTDQIAYPGELEERAERTHREGGIPLPPQTVQDLVALGERVGVTPDFA